jgi:hypothetical protein
MQTVTIEIEDNIYQNIVQSGINVQDKLKDFLASLASHKTISTNEAKQRVNSAILRYQTNPESFSQLTQNDWDEMEAKIIEKYGK